MVRVLRSTADSLASVLFPADCRICGDPLTGFSRAPVCDSHWANLSEQTVSLCARCGESLSVADFGAGAGELCRACRLAPPPFERAVAHGLYADDLRTLLHLLKYDGLEPIAAKLGALLAARLTKVENLPSRMMVVPVPLHAHRMRERGFNQSELLARAACTAMRRLRPEWSSEIAPKALARRRATVSQTELSPHERRRNLRGVFSAPRPEQVRGRNILLVDDIYTTGATARACSAALKRAGAAHIWVATVARAQRVEFGQHPRPQPAVHARMEQDFVMWDGGNTQA